MPPPDDDDNDNDVAAAPTNVVHLKFGARGGDARADVPAPTNPPEPEKRRAFARLILESMVLVHLDPRRPGVRVPARSARESQLALNFSHRFGVADFVYDDHGVRASLSFGGVPTFCDIPWSAVYSMRSHLTHETVMWPSSMPEELRTMLPPALLKEQGPVVVQEDVKVPVTTAKPKAGPPEKSARDYLRVVKDK